MNKKIFLLIFGMIFLFWILSSVSAFSWSQTNLYYNCNSATDLVSGSYNLENYQGSIVYNSTNALIGNSCQVWTDNNFRLYSPFTNLEEGTNRSMNLWFRMEDTTAYDMLYSNNASDNPQSYVDTGTMTLNNFMTTNPTGTATDGSWHMLTITTNGTGGITYLDSVQIGYSPLDIYWGNLTWNFGTNRVGGSDMIGQFDEISYFEKFLSSSDVAELWNGGAGITYSPSSDVNVTLNSPANNSIFSDTGAYFNATYNISTTNFNWTNATYNLWFSNGTLFNQTTINISGQDNFTSQFIDNFILENYVWNVNACYENSSYNNCTISQNNSFVVGATLDSESYDPFVYETELTSFEANISLLPGATLYDQKLYYNGTYYSGSKTLIGTDQYSLTKDFNVPQLNGSSSENRTFFWSITFQRSDGSFFFQNLTSHEQNVSQITLTSCTSGTIALNFTTWNEENNTRLQPFDFYGTFNYWLGDGSVYKSISFTNMSVNSSQFCLSENLTFYTNAQIQYEKTDYVKRSYYLINASLTNSTDHIKLFLLSSSVSTSFIIDIVDQNQIPVSGAYLRMQRYYPGLGTFETVEMGLTDTQGSTVGHFEAETEDYKIIITSNNTLLFESGVQKVFCRDTPCTLTFQIGSTNLTSWNNFGDITNLIWSLEYNETSKIWTYTYVDTSGLAQLGRLLVYTQGGTGNSTICNTNSSSTASTLTCNVTGQTGTIYAAAYIDLGDGEELVYLKSSIENELKNTFGKEGLFLAVFVLMVLAFAGLWNPAVGIVLVVFGVVIMSFIGLASFGAVTIWALVFIALIILWELNT